jgi:hypothetical protein
MSSGSNCRHLKRPQTEDARSIGQAYQLKPPNLQRFHFSCSSSSGYPLGFLFGSLCFLYYPFTDYQRCLPTLKNAKPLRQSETPANGVELVAQPSPFTDVTANDDIVIDSDPILRPLVSKAKASPTKKATKAAKPANKPSKTIKP